MRALHDRYAEAMKPLGLERGRVGSRATHQTVKQFYASVERKVELKVDHARIPDPPLLMLTAEAVAKYKEQVLTAVLDQLKEPIQTLRHQAMLTQDEHARRVEAERRSDARVEAAREEERAAAAEDASRAAERFANLLRSAQALVEENKELRAAGGQLLAQRDKLNELYAEAARGRTAERARAVTAEQRAAELGARLSDVPLVQVMQRLGYEQGEDLGDGQRVWRYEDGQPAMAIRDQTATDGRGQVLARNSLDLVRYVRVEWEGVEDFDTTRALQWVRAEFGETKAAAAMLIYTEQGVTKMFERDRERERAERQPARPGPEIGRDAPAHEREGSAFER